MKKHLDSLFLLAPALLWLLGSLLLGDDFALPNRLILAVLCAAAGAAGILMRRPRTGVLTLVAGIGMLAVVPVTHDTESPAFTLRLQEYELPLDYEVKPTTAAAPEADLVSVQGTVQQTTALLATQHTYPYTYRTCAASGRSLYARYPMTEVVEEQVHGATQVRGTLHAGDTAVRFVVLDFSGLRNEAEARSLAGAYLGGAEQPSIALIDSGDGGQRVPLEWIAYTTGLARSTRQNVAFTGTLDGPSDDSAQVLLHGPSLRCRSIEETASAVAATYSVY